MLMATCRPSRARCGRIGLIVATLASFAFTACPASASDPAADAPPTSPASSDTAIENRFDWNRGRTLHPGIVLVRERLTTPRPVNIVAARIDLTTPGLTLWTTGRAPEWRPNVQETRRETTRKFLERSRESGHPVVFAWNADAFSPWPAPFMEESPSDLLGLAVSDGQLVSPPAGTPSLVIRDPGGATIETTTAETPLDNVKVAVSGFFLCLIDGVVPPSDAEIHPRTGLGLSADGRYVIVMAADGRRHSTQGATTADLGTWLLSAGADDGINLDGGGSTTLAWWDPEQPDGQRVQLLNEPIGNGSRLMTPAADLLYVPTERANGNNLGVVLAPPP